MEEETILYHYTSINGFNEIIRSRKVWASDCRYLNDRHELMQAIEFFLLNLADQSLDALKFLIFVNGVAARFNCVFCLSKSPEILSQWRSYAEDGKGVAIGFKQKYLTTRITNTGTLVECIYEEHKEFLYELKTKLAEEIDIITKCYRDYPAVNEFLPKMKEKSEYLEKIMIQLLRVKNAAFKEEQEMRLVKSVPLNQIKTRVANGLIIPYVEHHIYEESLKMEDLWHVIPQIWIGPKCDKRNIEALGAFGQFGWRHGGIDTVRIYDCGYV